MLNLNALLALTSKPNFADVDLPVLRELYEQHLYPYKFEFMLDNGEIIILKFDLDKFCHLLAIEKTAAQQPRMSFARRKEYKGMRGWNNIKNGTLDKHAIRRLGVNLSPMRDKVLHFYYLPRLLANGSLVIKYVPTGTNGLQPELIIYDTHDNAFIQIGIQKEPEFGKWYYPETFLVNRITATNPTNKFSQPPSTVISIITRRRLSRWKKYTRPIKTRLRQNGRTVKK